MTTADYQIKHRNNTHSGWQRGVVVSGVHEVNPRRAQLVPR